MTLEHEHREGRTVPWLVEKLATHYSMSLLELRRLYGDLLRVTKHVILPVAADLVLLPIKTRSADAPGETTIGYCVLSQIDTVSDYTGGPGPWLSTIHCKPAYRLHTLHTAETLRNKIRQGEQVRHHYLQRRGPGPEFAGLSKQDIAGCLPNCDCLLLEFFRNMLHLQSDDTH